MAIIKNDNTHWIFICAIKSENMPDSSPERHLEDVRIGIISLLQQGISKNNISLLIDGPTPVTKKHILVHSELLSLVNKIDLLTDFNIIVSQTSEANIIICIYGHGSIYGLDSINKLKPTDLLYSLKLRNNLESAIVIFGQCFSGIYNFVDLYCAQETSSPTICFLGASNLNSSVSSSVINDDETGNIIELQWTANIFMLFLFYWIARKGFDIDGDGKRTLIDLYKYAGGRASENLLLAKERNAYNLYSAQIRLKEIEDQYLDKPIFSNDDEKNSYEWQYQLDKKSALKIMENLTNINHTVQDPWFLNANKAREIEFQL